MYHLLVGTRWPWSKRTMAWPAFQDRWSSSIWCPQKLWGEVVKGSKAQWGEEIVEITRHIALDWKDTWYCSYWWWNLFKQQWSRPMGCSGNLTSVLFCNYKPKFSHIWQSTERNLLGNQIFRSIDSNSVKGFPKDPREATSKVPMFVLCLHAVFFVYSIDYFALLTESCMREKCADRYERAYSLC